ncbi:MAG: Serine/threonine protein kinase [uncultured Aureispira sp.]|uniref:non-specific serine/threonine protein kinase n=1 Tax=uncultured Aureispira sp. TaxID=1331704 RepID=A0A6S6SNS4_9BACT|nr:MAG: Serine/threonine protein kinase [uncultured Aureispira sp.]
MPNKLHFYTKYSKEKIKISDKAFASGGEGAIYTIASPRNYSHLVAKIYYPEKRTKDREAKMQYLMQHPPIPFQKNQVPSIGWVQDLIYKEKRFLGILLIKIEGKKLTKLTLSKLPRRADKAWQRFAFQDPNSLKLRLRTCFNLAVAIYQIHENGQYVLVDLKPDNVLMQPNGLLAIVDMDSVEVIEHGNVLFAAPVATPEYTPPEHYIGERTVIEETWDRFSLGVIFYQLLLGLHPFAASAHPPYDNLVSIHDKIQQHLYVHNPAKKEFLNVIPPPHQRHDLLPTEVQQLFTECFTLGAENPFSRPSALDWCSTLARLLNLPFKGTPVYNLPLKQLAKIEFLPSQFYFKPALFTKNLDCCPYYLPYPIEPIDLSQIKSSIIIPIKTPYDSAPLETKQQAFWEAMELRYQNALKKHRTSLFFLISILIPLFILSHLFPSFFILGGILFFFTLPKLIFGSSKDIVYTIGKVVLPTSVEGISSKQHDFLAIEKQRQVRLQDLKTQKDALIEGLNQHIVEKQANARQHLEKATRNKYRLSMIKQRVTTQQVLLDKILLFNSWVEETLQLELTATKTRELEAYADLYPFFSKQFSKQLDAEKVMLKNTFRNFNNKKFKLERAIALQEKKLPTIVDKQIKQQLLLQYEVDLEASRLDFAAQLNAYKKINQEALPSEIKFSQSKKVLDQKLQVQLKYNGQKLQIELRKAKKQLGKNFQIHLKKYIDLLYNSGVATERHFAQHHIQAQFKQFLNDFSRLNLAETLQQELSSLLATERLLKSSLPAPSTPSNLNTLKTQQVGMFTEWTSIEKELQQLQKKVAQLQADSLASDKKGLTADCLDEIKTSILAIKSSEHNYHEFQNAFYSHPRIIQIHTKLKSYRATEQEKNNIEAIYLRQLHQLEAENPISEERNQLNEALERYQKDLMAKAAEKAKAIGLTYEQTLVELDKKWALEIKDLQKQLKENTEKLDQLKLDIESFEYDVAITVLDAEQAYPKELEKTRLKFDAIYKNYQATYDEKLDATATHYDRLKKNDFFLGDQIKAHRKQYAKDAKYPSIYRQDMDDLHAMEDQIKAVYTEIAALEQSIENTLEDKIKIETLIQWQENYSTKIYIKDLLLNKVEQFRDK